MRERAEQMMNSKGLTWRPESGKKEKGEQPSRSSERNGGSEKGAERLPSHFCARGWRRLDALRRYTQGRSAPHPMSALRYVSLTISAQEFRWELGKTSYFKKSNDFKHGKYFHARNLNDFNSLLHSERFFHMIGPKSGKILRGAHSRLCLVSPMISAT